MHSLRPERKVAMEWNQIVISVPKGDTLKDDLRKEAERSERSLSNLICTILRKHLKGKK